MKTEVSLVDYPVKELRESAMSSTLHLCIWLIFLSKEVDIEFKLYILLVHAFAGN